MERLKSIAVIFLLAAGVISPAVRAESVSSMLQQGLYAEETEGDLDKAMEIYQKIITRTNVYERVAAKARYQLGICYMKKGDHTKAARMFQEVITDFPNQRVIAARARKQLKNVGPSTTKLVEQAVRTISTLPDGDARLAPTLESLKELDDAEVVGQLAGFLDDNRATVRRSAIYILWKGNFDSIAPAVEKLTQLCSHEEDFTRGMAAIALGAGKVDSSFDIIAGMTLNDSSGYARRSAAYALGLFGDERAIPTLKKAAKDSDPLVAENARYMLSNLNASTQSETAEPVVERIIYTDETGKDCFFDLDTGKAFSPPQGLTRFSAPEKGIPWILENGIDFGNCVGRLQLWDMVAVEVEEKIWDSADAVEINSVLMKGPSKEFLPTSKEEYTITTPFTYAFETREGGIGLLQILEKRTTYLKIRYKMLQKETAEPIVVGTTPATGTIDVSPSLDKLSVTFNQTMKNGGWAWVTWDDPFPDIKGKASYDSQLKTCTLPVKLKPGQAYLVAFNTDPYIGFRSASGVPAKPYVLVFATKDKNGKPTPIPQRMLDKAERVNSLLVEPSYLQQTFNDIQPDGTIKSTITIREKNRSAGTIKTKSFINSDFVKVTAMHDDKGRPIEFTSTHSGDIYSYNVTFNEPILPGQTIVYSHEATMTGLINPVPGKEQQFRYFMVHSPGADVPTQRIETYLLPAGAELISTNPLTMQRSDKDGRIQLHVEKLITPGGNIVTGFQYQLSDVRITQQQNIILKDSFENGENVPVGWEKGESVDGVHYIWERKRGSDGTSSLCLKKNVQKYFPIAQWKRRIEHTGDAKKLRVSANVLAKKAYKAVIDALFLDDNDEWLKHEWTSYIGAKESGDPPANHNWKEYAGTVEIPENTKAIVISLQMYGPGNVWFDDLEVAYLGESEITVGNTEFDGDLQKLLDSAQPGDTVIVPDGVYTEPVKINKPLTLKGRSRTGCVFEVTANKPAIFIDTRGKGKASIEDITIKWQLATSDKGIEHPFAVAVKDSNAEVKGCLFLPLGNPQRSPVAIRAIGFSDLAINTCRFEGFEYVVCYGEGTKGVMRDSLIMNCGHQGIILYSGATVWVVGNVITGSKYHAVRSTGGNLSMRDNLIIKNENRGVYLGNKSGRGIISNNIIMDNETGISGLARSKVKIENNLILNSSYAGIAMQQSCTLSIRDNIFQANERGWIMFEKGGKGGNTCSRNTFWKNKIDAENFSKTGNSILEDPRFVSAGKGDFSLQAGPAKENKQGLTNPEIFKKLWKRWQNRKDRNEPFSDQAASQPAESEPITRPDSGGGVRELSRDDGKSANKRSIADSGHAVRFNAGAQGSSLKAIRIYGSRYGRTAAPKEDFHIWLCDENFEVLADFTFPYSKFRKGNAKWVNLRAVPTKLPATFILCADFNPTRTKGVYVHYDEAGSGNSFTALPGGELKEFTDGDWMIRAITN